MNDITWTVEDLVTSLYDGQRTVEDIINIILDEDTNDYYCDMVQHWIDDSYIKIDGKKTYIFESNKKEVFRRTHYVKQVIKGKYRYLKNE